MKASVVPSLFFLIYVVVWLLEDTNREGTIIQFMQGNLEMHFIYLIGWGFFYIPPLYQGGLQCLQQYGDH